MTDDRRLKTIPTILAKWFGGIPFLPFKGNNEYFMKIIQLLFSWKSIDVNGFVKRQSLFRFVFDN